MELKLIYIGLFLGLGHLLLGHCAAQVTANAQAGTGHPCTTDRIEKGAAALQGCVCIAGKDKGPTCQKCPLSECNILGLRSVSRLKDCGRGCVDGNQECDSCFIWFNSLCDCQKHNNCPTFSGNPDWVRFASGKLISVTKKTPGILELNSEAPWKFGQIGLDRKNKALTINSVKTRTQEQIHIHICPVKQIVQRILANQNYANFKTMRAIKMPVPDPNPWLCKVNPTKGGTIDGVTADIQAQIAKSPCKDYIGAGVIVDSNDRTWECVTTDDQPAQYTFCLKD